jgi:ATP-dependent Zn protease
MSKPQGTVKRPSALECTAYHEAGHAVVDLALGLTVQKVSIVPDDASNGFCRGPSVQLYEASGRKERRTVARAAIISCYAGLEAQRLVDPNPAEHHGDGDEDEAFELSRRWGVLPGRCDFIGDDRHQAYLDRLRTEARRLVKRQRAAVARLAAELLARRELEGAEVERIVLPLLAKGKRGSF